MYSGGFSQYFASRGFSAFLLDFGYFRNFCAQYWKVKKCIIPTISCNLCRNFITFSTDSKSASNSVFLTLKSKLFWKKKFSGPYWHFLPILKPNAHKKSEKSFFQIWIFKFRFRTRKLISFHTSLYFVHFPSCHASKEQRVSLLPFWYSQLDT